MNRIRDVIAAVLRKASRLASGQRGHEQVGARLKESRAANGHPAEGGPPATGAAEAAVRDAAMIRAARQAALGFSPSVGDLIGEQVAAHADATDATPQFHTAPAAPAGPLSVGVGSHIGPYRLLDRLGEGGFGVVYLAEQERPVRRRVAVKLIRLGMDSQRVLARFEAERQAIALMEHPAIATVLDVGVSDSGTPYFAMEYVPGSPITRVCDRARLGIDERLRVFVRVCGGVQHAHTKGVIHRDLKPSNILATIDEGASGVEVVPKIIDFGVAKALDQSMAESPAQTEAGHFVGTPEYMSPEQAGTDRVDVDTRSDIYALGVLLYELLTGALPFDSTALRKAGLSELLRIIRDVEPLRPSSRVTGSSSAANTASLSEVAHNRGIDPSRLHGRLRGDLDWIVMKCLEKDRNRRYGSAHELAADIRRYLATEPVLARPPEVRYRMGKFVRRNRGAVLAGSLAAVALAAGAVGLGVGAVRSVQASRSELAHARVAEVEARKAATEAAIAVALTEFLTDDLLAAARPSQRGVAVTMREVLDQAAEKIDDRFEGQPLVEAAIRRALGRTYVALGVYELGEPHLERALELRSHELTGDDRAVLESMDDLGTLRRRQGRFEDAVALLGPAVETSRRVLGEGDPLTLASTNNLAVLLVDMGRLAEAEPLHRATLEWRRRELGTEHITTLRSMNNLGALLRRLGRFDEAESLYVEGLATRRRTLGETDPSTLVAMNNLATLYLDMRRPDDAAALLEELLATELEIFGAEHPDRLSAMQNLAALRSAQERHADAEVLLRELLDVRGRVLGPEHPDTLTAMNALSASLVMLERADEALALVDDALGIASHTLDVNSVHFANLLHTRGRALTRLGRHEEAESPLLEAHGIVAASLGPNHQRTRRCAEALAKLYDAWGKPEESAEWSARASADGTAAQAK